MSATRELTRPPASLSLLLRAGLPLLPGASALPFVAGGGGDMPDTVLTLRGARLSAERLDAYARVCAFAPRQTLPASAPHLLAFPLHMALMTDASFPFPAVGLVHVANRIEQHRPIGASEGLDLRVRATPLQAHPRGRTFALLTEARVGEELVWEERSTMLRRGSSGGSSSGGEGGRRAHDGAGGREAHDGAGGPPVEDGVGGTPLEDGAGAPGAGRLARVADWRLPEDLGRRYGSVSGDRNPIHMHALSAKLFGFPRAIAHGMWTKARCLAALEDALPGAFAVQVDFRKPILLPGHVAFARGEEGEQTSFAVSAAERPETIHLEGTVTR